MSQFNLLICEDDLADLETVKYVLRSMKYSGEYQHLSLGQDVMDWISQPNNNKSKPSLILLDIGLPGIDGKKLLKMIREHETIQFIPVAIVSGSISQKDFNECVALGCNAYIQKDADLEKFKESLQCVIRSWMNLAQQTFY